jgi:hypothetical protein
MANEYWKPNKSVVKKLRLLNKPFLKTTIDTIFENLSNEQTDKNNDITLQQLLDDSSLDLPDSLKTEILNNIKLSKVLEIILKTKVKRPEDSLINLTGVILTDIEEKILELVTDDQLRELLGEISDKFQSYYLSNLKKKYDGDFSYVPLHVKVKELMVSRKNFDSSELSTTPNLKTPYSELSTNTPTLNTPNTEIPDERCRKKCGWSFNKTKCLTKCKTKLNQVKEDMRLINIATKNRQLCETKGYNCWSRRNFRPNKCKIKCALDISSKIEPTLEYAKFIAHLYSNNAPFLCNKLFVQFIENSESINELISLLNGMKQKDVSKHGITNDYKKQFEELLKNFAHVNYSENIKELKESIEQSKKSLDCVKNSSATSFEPDSAKNVEENVENINNELQNLHLGGFKSKNRKRIKRKTKRFSNKK